MLPSAPLAAFSTFGRHMVRSADIDPVYPVLRQLIADLHLDEPGADWLTVLYLAYYELSSAVTAFTRYPDPGHHRIHDSLLYDLETLKLPTGIERRGLRDARCMRAHLNDWLERFDGRSFFTGATELFIPPQPPHGDQREFNYGVLEGYLGSVRYNGRWACYKATEVLQKVRDYPVRAVDAGHANSSGPRSGLTLFFPEVTGNGDAAIARLDEQTELLMRCAAEHGLELAVEECETLLCDFRSLTLGRYYVGHDIDLMLEGVNRASEDTKGLLIRARRSLPKDYRGELFGWDGRDRDAMHAYAQRGAIMVRREGGGWEEAR